MPSRDERVPERVRERGPPKAAMRHGAVTAQDDGADLVLSQADGQHGAFASRAVFHEFRAQGDRRVRLPSSSGCQPHRRRRSHHRYGRRWPMVLTPQDFQSSANANLHGKDCRAGRSPCGTSANRPRRGPILRATRSLSRASSGAALHRGTENRFVPHEFAPDIPPTAAPGTLMTKLSIRAGCSRHRRKADAQLLRRVFTA